jgi:hypothetical protein
MLLAFYPAEAGAAGLRAFRDAMAAAPEELMALAIFWNALAIDELPAAWHEQPVFVLAGCYSGPSEQAEAALEPLRAFANPLADLSGPVPFLEMQRLFDPDYPDGRRYYWKSRYLTDLDAAAIAALERHAAARPSPLTSLDVWALGGAMRREPVGGAAFAGRDHRFLIGIEANWDEPTADDANVAWARETFRDLGDLGGGGAYLNFPGFGEETDFVRAAYGPHYDRLVAVKTRYDPTNLFRINQNIRPA